MVTKDVEIGTEEEANFREHSAMLPEGATMQEALRWRQNRVEEALESGDVDKLAQEYLNGNTVGIDEFYDS